ncbi:Eco57I restriction-modification methylase domain-containing protein [Candidatus Spongiihabitans sp.]|uniref:Eco57I restriction-modification methylase domain-containing protein n=1 Tax=Candidatus Spongiihabitans sp. TaxID=3101308 RepID=UPI003C6F159A
MTEANIETHIYSSADTMLKIKQALNAFKSGDLRERACEFFNALGYSSDRTHNLHGGPEKFVAKFPAPTLGTKTEKYFLKAAKSVHIVFQVTDEEIQSSRKMNLLAGESFDKGCAKSFLFMAVKLQPGDYARGKYAEMTREINKRFGMPTVVLFLNGNRTTLAFVHRREHKKQNRDVLGKVSLIREANCADPHRAHLDILAELSLGNCLGWIEQKQQQRNFDGLLAAWLAKLDTEELNKRFYKELFNWFQWAVAAAKFPCPEKKPVSMEDHIIRLITRILFVWFVKEKELVTEELFIETRVSSLLKKYRRDNDDYYRAVLQNLFFATLNTEISKRRFSKARGDTHRNFNLYRYKDLLAKPEQLLHLMKQTPFINGGLFDCLDSEEATGDSGYRLDCFSDNKQHRKLLSVPNRLFFDDVRGLFPLLNKYKFTVEENTPIEQEVALDPELLGKVFENLLAAYNPETSGSARKQTGSYYTPRAIVDYMVDEALVASLAEKVKPADDDAGFWRERLRDLLDYATPDCLIEAEEIEPLVEAISAMKILDPAAGSGAFPMGVLHKLTLALGKLDPKNKRWRELQKKRAMKETETAYSEQKDRDARDALLQEISDTFERYSSDFGRKLYLIQNSIFGIDIQPIACQIAKLRFFISLAIEQRRDDNQENYGIKPLPNLETRFVAADTLIGLQLTQRDTLQSTEIRALEEQLQQNRERHFNAGTRRKKLECSRKDRELRSTLAEILKTHYQRDSIWQEALQINNKAARALTAQLNKYNAQITAAKQATLMVKEDPHQTSMTDEKVAVLKQKIADKQKLGTMISKRDEAVRNDEIWKQAKAATEKKNEMIHAESQKIADWDPYDQNAKADWFDAEWMFGARDGFDIVIGNPPYINVESMSAHIRKRIMSSYATCEKRTDIYIAFFEKSLDMLNTNGAVQFIVPHSFTTQKYGQKMRCFMTKKYVVHEIVDASSYRIFEKATVFNVVVRVGKSGDGKTLIRHHNCNDDFKNPSPGFFIEQSRFMDMKECRFETRQRIFDFLPIKQKLWKRSCPLKDICLIAYGARLNHKSEKIGKSHYISAEPIPDGKKFTEGENIKRYHFSTAGWLNYHPKEHYNPMFRSLFENEKLMLINIVADRLRFAYDSNQHYNSHTVVNCVRLDMLKGESHITALRALKNGDVVFAQKFDYKFLLGVLNSQLVNWYFLSFLSEKLHCYPDDAKSLPIPIVPVKEQSNITNLADKILAAKAQNPNADTSELETEIDTLVYQLYNLTDEEIIVIEKNI